MIAETLSNWAAIAGIAAALVATVGLLFVVVQLRQATAAARTQATIQFQEAFKESRKARSQLQLSFPVHSSVLGELVAPTERVRFAQWDELSDLTEDQRLDADAVINALNDVAQYVSDGMPLRSALQQYHSIFVRAGALLFPYIDRINASRAGISTSSPIPQTRRGVRVIELFNAGLGYHRSHPKHTGRELSLERPAVDGGGLVRLVLIDIHLGGLEEHSSYMHPRKYELSFGRRRRTARQVIRQAERNLRR